MAIKKYDFPIDLVYLWVDGNDPCWLEKNKHYLHRSILDNKNANHVSRFSDNDELKYSLRSVEKYAPWINQIYIVTDNQVPKWLDTRNRKIKIIDHTTIFQKDGELPNFSSCAIEWLIYRIPSLSEHFLYFNDDIFLWSKVYPWDFFTVEGKAKFPLVKKMSNNSLENIENWRISRINAKKILCEEYKVQFPYEVIHTARPFVKKAFEQGTVAFNKYFQSTVSNRFRSNIIYSNQKTKGYDASSLELISCYMLKNDYAILKELRAYRITQNCTLWYDSEPKTFSLVTNKALRLLRLLTKKAYFREVSLGGGAFKRKLLCFKFYKPKHICLNDNEHADEESRLLMQKFLEKYFPEKSRYEK